MKKNKIYQVSSLQAKIHKILEWDLDLNIRSIQEFN